MGYSAFTLGKRKAKDAFPASPILPGVCSVPLPLSRLDSSEHGQRRTVRRHASKGSQQPPPPRRLRCTKWKQGEVTRSQWLRSTWYMHGMAQYVSVSCRRQLAVENGGVAQNTHSSPRSSRDGFCPRQRPLFSSLGTPRARNWGTSPSLPKAQAPCAATL
ncbi:uncharacterized protein LY79DRAFT_542358 [Colletotrichum navitas]|uniref:Uncharacterized protein n=1 Tax=Colletotrichum navitas TaxID=681940 RepID=A0AAD8Q753_9PEZI|nr:uncharacterized protein LY79DRAFT_542358 [Colletotrichum navitas]KAK1597166.1 hypothetical protein LY79DRAFT_542358 [Colletotrichum navitas]